MRKWDAVIPVLIMYTWISRYAGQVNAQNMIKNRKQPTAKIQKSDKSMHIDRSKY